MIRCLFKNIFLDTFLTLPSFHQLFLFLFYNCSFLKFIFNMPEQHNIEYKQSWHEDHLKQSVLMLIHKVVNFISVKMIKEKPLEFRNTRN